MLYNYKYSFILAVVLFVLCLSASNRLMAAPFSLPHISKCERVDFRADKGTCQADQCVLEGNARLLCDDLVLRANTLEIHFYKNSATRTHTNTNANPNNKKNNGGFAGAIATGSVWLSQGGNTVRCDKIELGEDHIRGKILAAEIKILKSGLILHGDIERLDNKRMTIDNARFTLCDCGDAPPSWQVRSGKIEINNNEQRALIWWPSLYLSPFGLGPIPVTPPLLPLSVSMKKRAFGLLAPHVAFMGGLDWPTVGLPLFIPMGRSYDLTLTPGARFDHHVENRSRRPPNEWMVPQLGVRLRYRPSKQLKGSLDINWIEDKQGLAALTWQGIYNEDNIIKGIDGITAAQQKILDGRKILSRRVGLTFKQRYRHKSVQWLTDLRWVSDDLLLADYRISQANRVVDYLPSRTLLSWRSPALSAVLGAEHFLKIGADPAHYSNLDPVEQAITQRQPFIRARLLPTEILSGPFGTRVVLDSALNGARYGATDRQLPYDLLLGGGRLGVALNSVMKGIQSGVKITGYRFIMQDGIKDYHSLGTYQLDFYSGVTFAKTFNPNNAYSGLWVHSITPEAHIRSLPQVFTKGSPQRFISLESDLDANVLQQGELSLAQRWTISSNGTTKTRFKLNMAQPFNLDTLSSFKLLASRLSAGWYGDTASLSGRISARLPFTNKTKNTGGGGLQDFTIRGGLRHGPWRLGGDYVRLAPSSERFLRTPYQFAGDSLLDPTECSSPGADLATCKNRWVHSARGSIGYKGPVFQASYGATWLLPRKGEQVDINSDFMRPYANLHFISVGYSSPCKCWGFKVFASVPAVNRETDTRVKFSLIVGEDEVSM